MKLRLLGLILAIAGILSGVVWENYWKEHDAERQAILSENIYKRIEKNEKVADALLNDTNIISEYAVLNFKENVADKVHENGFELLAFNGDSMVYWSTERVTIDSCLDDLRKGSTFLKTQNGIFQVYKKNKGYYNYLLLFLIKNEYLVQNTYLENRLSEKWEEIENIKVSLVKLPEYCEIKSPDGKYYFSFKCVSNRASYPFWLKMIIILGCILFFFCVESFIIYFGKKKIWWGTLAFFMVIIVARLYQIFHQYPVFAYDHEIFGPKIYASNSIFPSLADFLINMLIVCRLLFACLSIKEKSSDGNNIEGWGKYIITIILLSIPFFSCYLIQTLIVDSTISLNFTTKSINYYTLYALLGVSLCTLTSYLSIRLLPSFSLFKPRNFRLISVLLFIICCLLFWLFTNIYIIGLATLVGLLIIIVYGPSYTHLQKSFFSLLLASVTVGLLFSKYNKVKERDARSIITQNIYERRDSRAERLMVDIDRRIQNDFSLKKILSQDANAIDLLKKRIKENYFTGYLGHYNISIYAAAGDSSYSKLDEVDSIYTNNSNPIENTNFSRIHSSSTWQGYIAKYIFEDEAEIEKKLYIVLQPKALADQFVQTELFSQNNQIDLFQNPEYSWCMYRDNKLFNNHGIYNYPVVLEYDSLKFKDNFYEFNINGYDHLAYNNNSGIVIISSVKSEPFYRPLTYVLFFVSFFVQVLFALFLLSTIFHFIWHIRSLFQNKKRYFVLVFQSFKNNYISGGSNLSLLSNQIQLILAFLIVITIVVTAFISQQGIVNKFNENQKNKLLSKIKQVAYEVENDPEISSSNYQVGELNKQIGKLSELYACDINLYDLSGSLLATSQPKIFEFGILSNRINPQALQQLYYINQSQFIHNENIGNLNYLSAYIPIIENNKKVAYINLPFFSKEAELETEIKSNIISLITPYSLIFIIISLFSYIISLRVSNSLNFIRLKLAQTTFGKKNNKLVWNKRDEIGALVRQYNLMIDQLDESAEMLAKTERDQAWREMAKQIAHEIKNPLTPMKLNLQMLQRSAHENVSDLEAHVKRVSNLLIEQIDSLSQLAGEFSSFARMTEGNPERVNLDDICKKITLLYHMPTEAIVNFHHDGQNHLVMINPDGIQRVMNNLVKNAIQAAKEGTVPEINIYISLLGSKVMIKVQDNGTGIPHELRDHIFEPNFSTKNSGMGLGLAIVKKIIERANGKIWFETEMAVGSTFFIELDLVS